MSAEPSVGNLLDIAGILDRGVQSELSPNELLVQVMPVLLPHAQFTRVYRLGGNKAFLQAATSPGTDILLDRSSVHVEATRRFQPVQDGTTWVAPLHIGDEIFGLLEVGLPEDSGPRTIDTVRLAAHLLAPTLHGLFTYNRDISIRSDDALSLVQSLYDASGTIYGTENAVDILKSINGFTGNIFAHVHLAVLDVPEQPNRLHIIAEADADGPHKANHYASLEDYPASEALVALEALTVQDVN